MRLAFFLIIVFTVLFFAGSLLPQVPARIAAGSTEYASWLQQAAYPITGAWTGVLAMLQLFDVFHSIWFTGAGILLILNILICTWNRLRFTLKTIGRKPAARDDSFYASLPVREVFESNGAPSERVLSSVTAVLKKRHYHVKALDENGNRKQRIPSFSFMTRAEPG